MHNHVRIFIQVYQFTASNFTIVVEEQLQKIYCEGKYTTSYMSISVYSNFRLDLKFSLWNSFTMLQLWIWSSCSKSRSSTVTIIITSLITHGMRGYYKGKARATTIDPQLRTYGRLGEWEKWQVSTYFCHALQFVPCYLAIYSHLS